MPSLLLAVYDEQSGNLLVDTSNPTIGEAVQADLSEQLGTADAIACARPISYTIPDARSSRGPGMRISALYHGSVIEGPGRRSVLRVQGCPIRCKGCYVPETHDENGGFDRPIDVIADALLDPAYERDGVTILGGEPFAQPAALHSLIGELRGRQPNLHICVYTGYMLESLRSAWALRFFAGAAAAADIAGVLESTDMLIDGPYIAQLADSAGPWTGSGNQRVRQRLNLDGQSAWIPWKEGADAPR
jgi:anaerobic ribonucleoside-triphosphate reductase activating protein